MLERDERALVGERPRDGRPGTAAGTGDEHDPFAQAEIHGQAPGARRSRWVKNSARVRSRVRKSPSTDEVVITVPGLRTPRMTAHRWVASSTTPTPCGSSRSWRKSAICWVSRSWTWSRRRVHLDDARDLRQPDDPASRDVGDRGGPEERQQVVLAQRVERDVLDHDHLAVGDVEDGAVDEPLGVDVVAGGQLGVHPVDATGRPDQALRGRDPRRSRSRISWTAASTRPLAPVPAVRPGPLDGRGGPVGVVADLVLDLVDDALDVAGQVGLAGQDVTPMQAAMVRRESAVLPPRPGASRGARGGRGSRARTAAPRRNATAAMPPRARSSPRRRAGDRVP